MKALDLLDRQILFELDYNSRQSLSTIAKKLKQGRDRISYRIRRLEDLGILLRYTTAINPCKIGFTIFKTYLKLENDKQRIETFVDYLDSHPRAYWIAECEGQWDLIFVVLARSVHEFYEIQEQIVSQCSDILISTDVFILVNGWMCRRNYILNQGSEHIFVGGAPGNYTLDPLEFAMLEELSRNARLSNVELAERLDTTPNIVKYRIEQLEEHEIIIGHRTELDLAKLNMTFFKAQIYRTTFDSEREREFIDYCLAQPNITYFLQQVGDCNLEIELEVESYQEFNAIIGQLKERFRKFIRNIETNLVTRERYHWVPQDSWSKQNS